MAEPFLYRKENVTDQSGRVVDTATFRIPNPNFGRTSTVGATASGYRSGSGTLDWSNAEYRGASAGGRVRQYIRSAAGRMAARNPAERYGQYSRATRRNNRYGI